MPGLFTADMHTTITAALVTDVDKDDQPTLDPKKTHQCRHEPDGKVIRGPDGSVVETKDVLYTHDALTTSHLIWLPGADTSKIEEAHEPSKVNKTTSLDGSDTLYEVVL